jgi:hypothetical protein
MNRLDADADGCYTGSGDLTSYALTDHQFSMQVRCVEQARVAMIAATLLRNPPRNPQRAQWWVSLMAPY